MENEEKAERNNKFQWAVLIILIVAWVVNVITKSTASHTLHIDFSYPFMCSIIFLFYYLIGKISPVKLFEISGVKKPKTSKVIFYAIGIFVGIFVIGYGINVFSEKILQISSKDLVDPADLDLLTALKNVSRIVVILRSASVYFVQTFFEEFAFRGLLLRKLLSKYNFWIANIIHAIVFALFHLPLVFFVVKYCSPNVPTNYIILLLVVPLVGGLLFGYAYAKTDNNLFPSWISHFLLNFSHDLLLIFFGIST